MVLKTAEEISGIAEESRGLTYTCCCRFPRNIVLVWGKCVNLYVLL